MKPVCMPVVLYLRLVLTLVLTLTLPFSTAFAEGDDQPSAFMQARLLDAEGEVTDSLAAKVGQRVTLALDTYTPSWFARAPEIEPLVVAGAVALQAQGFAINYSERIDGVRYTVQRRELSIFPQRAGQFIVPSQTARLWLGGDMGQTSGALRVRSEPLVFQVTHVRNTDESGNPDESNNPARLLVANQLHMNEAYEPSLALLASGEKTLRAGDAMVRRVTLSAQGTLGMLIQPLQWLEIEGVQQQAIRARVSDRTERGEFTGVRQMSRSYVFERAGLYQLPAQDIYWWDAVNQRLAKTSLAAQRVTVLPSNLASAAGAPSKAEKSRLEQGFRIVAGIISVLVAAVVIGFLLLHLLRLLIRAWRKPVQRYRASMAYARRQLLRACARGDSDQTVRCFYRWQELLPVAVLATPQGAELQAAMNSFYKIYYCLADDDEKTAAAHDVKTAATADVKTAAAHDIKAAAAQRLAASVKAVTLKRTPDRSFLPSRRALVELNPR